ncbi:ATP-binding protein [Cohaesibacter haloalkalitolerans]|uniref:ATP-binding protein n=1 Tax=Cohaesibacter haloalkalitolerans TaxID=1162980 RepID=UPI0013C4EB97|nr:HAMP domain-containing sensor histidine kinase [Cohaesibacter haloalkalitolerans]
MDEVRQHRKDEDGHGQPDQPTLPSSSAENPGGEKADKAGDRDKGYPRFGLSTKLLLLTIIFVMLSEILIFVPSISKFRVDWLTRKLELAEVAALVYTNASDDLKDKAIEQELLDRLNVQTLGLRNKGERRLLAMVDMPGTIMRDDNIQMMGPPEMIAAAFDTLLFGKGRTIRVVGQTKDNQGMVEMVFDETGLRRDMIRFSINILLLSLVISVMTAGLVYLSLRALLVRPILRVLDNMARFTSNPEDSNAVMKPSRRRDEIGMIEMQLGEMEGILAKTLYKQRRLADLGLAVSKINHDLRNIIASAQLFSDRLSMLDDPTVQRVVPKLMGTLDRAVDYSRAVMSYGKAQEAPPEKRLLNLHQLGEEMRDLLDLSEASRLTFSNHIPEDLEIYADPGQLFRVLMNLCRNAVDVMQYRKEEAVICRLELAARIEKGRTIIEVSDTGPGVPAAARANLFRPFQGSARKGGTGLGLAIAAEIIRAHGGTIRLLDRVPGAHFEISLPRN